MTEQEFEVKFNNYEFDEAYAEYIMDHCHGDRVICNGDTLTDAMEDLYLFDDFKDSLVDYQTV
jgi:hypothetical protein